jgi:hypothetical protein
VGDTASFACGGGGNKRVFFMSEVFQFRGFYEICVVMPNSKSLDELKNLTKTGSTNKHTLEINRVDASMFFSPFQDKIIVRMKCFGQIGKSGHTDDCQNFIFVMNNLAVFEVN